MDTILKCCKSEKVFGCQLVSANDDEQRNMDLDLLYNRGFIVFFAKSQSFLIDTNINRPFLRLLK